MSGNGNASGGAVLFDITKYCQNANCQKLILYNQMATGGNDPTITKRARFAQIIGNPRACNKSGCNVTGITNDFYTQFPFRPATSSK